MKTIKLYHDDIGSVELIQKMGDELTIVNAARVSLGKHKEEEDLDKKDVELIKYLLDKEHTSPFEHCVMTFRFVVPMFVRSQHHRHRTWSFNEISRRYTSDDLKFYLPVEFRKQHKSNRQASTSETFDPIMDNEAYYCNDLIECSSVNCNGEITNLNSLMFEFHDFVLHLYNKMIDKGVCREQARGILPMNTYTEYYGTIDLHNALKFVQLRLHEGAQWEIQQVAKAMLNIMKDSYPVTVKHFMDMKGLKDE